MSSPTIWLRAERACNLQAHVPGTLTLKLTAALQSLQGARRASWHEARGEVDNGESAGPEV